MQVECRDAGDPMGWSQSADLCFVLMMEVLDNCPHDRIHRDPSSGDWQQACVIEAEQDDQVSRSSAVRSNL